MNTNFYVPTDTSFDNFICSLERVDPRADMGEYTLEELKIMYQKWLDDIDKERKLNIIKKSNINRVMKYIYSWELKLYSNDYETWYQVENIPALHDHRFYEVDTDMMYNETYKHLLKEYGDAFSDNDYIVKELFVNLIDDIKRGLWSVDLRDRDVRAILNYLNPILDTNVIDLIMNIRKADSDSDVSDGPVVDPALSVVNVSNILFEED